MSIIDLVAKKFNLNPSKTKIIKNVYWAMLGKIVNVVSGLFVGVLVARYLGPSQYGLMSYVIGYVSLFAILAAFGLDSIEIRELSKNKISKDLIMGTAFIIRIVFAFLTLILIAITLLLFESDVFTSLMVMVYSSSLIFSSFNIIRNYFTSIVLNEYVVKTEIVRTIIGAGIKVVLLFFKAPLSWFIVATCFDFLLIAGGYVFSYRKKVGLIKNWRFDKVVAKHLVIESFPLLLSGAAIIIYQKIDQVMIRNMMNNDSLGQFSVASKFAELVIFLPTVAAQTVTPMLVQYHHSDKSQYKFRSQQFMDLMVWGSILMALFICIASPWIITIVYGKAYLAAIPVLQIMTWKAVGMALSTASGQLIITEGLQKYAFWRNIVGCFVCVILNYILIPTWGIIGSASATVVTMMITGYFSHYAIPPFRYLFKMQSISLFMGWRSILAFITKKKSLL